MRRDRAWWARLDKDERSELVYLEYVSARSWGGHSAYLPDDCYECPSCGQPGLGGGLCNSCDARLQRLIAKGNGEAPGGTRCSMTPRC